MKYEKLLNLFTLKGDVYRPQFAKPNKANGTVPATDAEALIFFDENLASNIETNSKYPDIRMVVPDSNCNTIMNMESLTVLLSKLIKELKGKYLNLGELRKEQEQERERSGGKDTVEEYTDQLSKIKNYAAEVISNRAEIQRLSKEDERGRIEGGIRNVEATILLAASGRESGQIKGREEQQRAIEDYAKAEGIWYDNIDANPDIGT